MKVLFKKILIFGFIFLLVSEILARLLHVSTDATRSYKHKNGNLRLIPNQQGYWSGGSHKWFVNELGYPGKEIPKSFDNLVAVIGDSYIQNFMNPDSCRQANYLREFNPNYNYIELARAGATLLEYFELGNEADSLGVKFKLIYTNTNDFTESVKNIASNKNLLQLDVDSKELYFPVYGGSSFKNLLYNFKFLYFLYRDNLNLFKGKKNGKKTKKYNNKSLTSSQLESIKVVLDFISDRYPMENVIFVLHPFIDEGIVKIIKQRGIRFIRLIQPKGQNWSKEKDRHWSCYGHKQVAKQVSSFLIERN